MLMMKNYLIDEIPFLRQIPFFDSDSIFMVVFTALANHSEPSSMHACMYPTSMAHNYHIFTCDYSCILNLNFGA